MFLSISVAGASGGDDPLRFYFDGKRGQVEVGGPFVGVEFHESRPVPSRISFYSPVANSIDLSTDYWKRGESLPLSVGMRIGHGPAEWLQHESWPYVLSPHKVTFMQSKGGVESRVSYEFGRTEPITVIRFQFTNSGKKPLSLELCTNLVLSLRTCQTYVRKDTSWVVYKHDPGSVVALFDDADTDSAAVFVQNVGAQPVEWSTDAAGMEAAGTGEPLWPQLQGRSSPDASEGPPRKTRGAAAFVYRAELAPGDSLEVDQVVGSCRRDQWERTMSSLRDGWSRDILDYDEFVRDKAQNTAFFQTGDSITERSATWARGLIAANAHYIDGRIVPMPCPAEYNFFFTHDLLLTDLGAVQFDLQRVKSDLLFVVSMAKDSVIPHAYYWRDNGFKTEYCEPENWNHLWFVLVSGAYLRHSLDDSTGNVLYPFLMKSVRGMLTCLHEDSLMHAFRPDWWDIGHIEGSRAYLSALAIRALREYVFISSFLGKHTPDMLQDERVADAMQTALGTKLWDDHRGYLMNYNGKEEDYHFYAGSLIAPVYGLIDRSHTLELLTTASTRLVDERIGVRIAMPPDFVSDSVITKFKFAGHEAGPPFSYANGAVWPHGNAWYAMALKRAGKGDEAYDFLRRTMTVDGIALSPNGQPAMYECRYSNPESREFGTIDKPSFLWSAGTYLEALYDILAVREDPWNIEVREDLPSQVDSVACSITFGGTKILRIRRVGNAGILQCDGRELATRILALDMRTSRTITLSIPGRPTPLLAKANAIVNMVAYDGNLSRLSCDVSSFNGHSTLLVFESHTPPKEIDVDGSKPSRIETSTTDENLLQTTVAFPGSAQLQHITVTF